MFTSAVAIAANAYLGAIVAAVVAIFANIWLTGALHEDGLADFCDGFGHAHDRKRTLEIMRDPRCGVYGALGLIGSILTRTASVYTLLLMVPPLTFALLMTLVAALSRGAAVMPMRSQTYARPEDSHAKGARLSHPLTGGWLVLCATGALLPLAIATVVVSPYALMVMPLVAATYAVMTRAFITRLGGYTGDCLGALQQLTAIITLLALVALSRTHTFGI